MWRPLMSVITTLYYVATWYSSGMWSPTLYYVAIHVLSLRYACNRSSGILHTSQVPNFVLFAVSIAELAHGEKSHAQSITR